MFVSVKISVVTDQSGTTVDVPSMMTPSGVLRSLVDYFVAHSNNRSIAWMNKIVLSVQKFFEYVRVNSMQTDSHLLIVNFANKLYKGTCDPATGDDPSGLFWD